MTISKLGFLLVILAVICAAVYYGVKKNKASGIDDAVPVPKTQDTDELVPDEKQEEEAENQPVSEDPKPISVVVEKKKALKKKTTKKDK